MQNLNTFLKFVTGTPSMQVLVVGRGLLPMCDGSPQAFCGMQGLGTDCWAPPIKCPHRESEGAA